MLARLALPGFGSAKAVLLVIGLLAALSAATLPAATAAHAADPDHWGFAYLDNPTPPSNYVPDSSRQWGSWASPSSNPVTVNQTALGSYTVRFPQIGGTGGVAHVTAVTTKGDWCQLDGWQPAGADEDVMVSCYAPDGASINSQFAVAYTSSSAAGGGTLASASDGHAYIYAAASGSIISQYNSAGPAESVTKTGVGGWDAWLPDQGLATPVGNLQVTAVDPKVGARCKVGTWTPAASGQTVSVVCFDAENEPYDTAWTLSYSNQRSLYGAAFPPKSFGYLWFNGSVPPATSYNSTGATNSLSSTGPDFVVTMPGAANTPDDTQATGYGPDPSYCDLTQPWDRTGGSALVYVDCFSPGGSSVEAPFFAAYSSAF